MNGKPYRGIVYSALNDKGEKMGNPFKSSLFGKSVGIEALEKRIEKSTEIITNKRLKERSKQLIAASMRTTNNRADFEKALEKQGMSVLFRTNDEGRIYGATFVDYRQKCVFYGSRLGREFSANIFNDLFNGKNIPETDNPSPKSQMSHTTQTNDESSGIGGIFDLPSPETRGDEIEEQNFTRRMKRKRKQQRRA